MVRYQHSKTKVLLNSWNYSPRLQKKPNLIYLRGLEPILDEPSHSWTQKEVMLDPSTDCISQTRDPLNISLSMTMIYIFKNNFRWLQILFTLMPNLISQLSENLNHFAAPRAYSYSSGREILFHIKSPAFYAKISRFQS